MKTTVSTVQKMKDNGEKITMLTAYDYSTAKLFDEAGIDTMLVGDSLGMVMLGYDSTIPVTVDDMIHHGAAVVRGAKNAMIVVDMPFLSYHTSVYDAVANAGRIMKETGCTAVKLEGGKNVCPQIEAIVNAQIPVCAHIGLTPQSSNMFGGFRVQGKSEEAAKELIEAAQAVEKAGAFMLVLEGIPEKLAAIITKKVHIPTIGIGASAECDGQVLVYQDMLAMYGNFVPKFVKQFAQVGEVMQGAVKDYINAVKEGTFPGPENTYGLSVGFVPTMGYLHEGHKSLMDAARKGNDKVVVSIFVNPMQFGPTEDLATYPRDLDHDAALCESAGVDLIFHPEAEEMYEKDFCSFVDMTGLTEGLCGKTRPIHFRGVCTVVNKLFNIVTPDHAYFGQKDGQQLAVIKRMVRDLNMDIEIVGCPIVREEDGLAKSSRNTYLSSEERKAALILSKTVALGKELAKTEKDANKVVEAMKKNIETEPLAKIDYVEAVDALSMAPVEKLEGTCMLAMAVYIGKTRLIDNTLINE